MARLWISQHLWEASTAPTIGGRHYIWGTPTNPPSSILSKLIDIVRYQCEIKTLSFYNLGMIIFNEAGPYITLEIIFAALDFKLVLKHLTKHELYLIS